MSQLYKEKILKDLNEIPVDMLPRFYKIVHFLKSELIGTDNKTRSRNSLKGMWKGCQIDEDLFEDAKKSLFNYS